MVGLHLCYSWDGRYTRAFLTSSSCPFCSPGDRTCFSDNTLTFLLNHFLLGTEMENKSDRYVVFQITWYLIIQNKIIRGRVLSAICIFHPWAIGLITRSLKEQSSERRKQGPDLRKSWRKIFYSTHKIIYRKILSDIASPSTRGHNPLQRGEQFNLALVSGLPLPGLCFLLRLRNFCLACNMNEAFTHVIEELCECLFIQHLDSAIDTFLSLPYYIFDSIPL